ncbi:MULTISPECIES: hypothetical protein [Prochlorococcus]|uniref:Uncharacterized membrane protein n=1 Tax=Prochlorococcus marinus (strain SARG / CCMP1375 / SS120) TaxID=167539 RepID=Q7VCR8_PROMA|nr:MULTISPECIES: hypothetical protein [Prochlorococcus]AAP99716.1 Uncharacterized membrane protein [Prochlorococcus marinus subsp. marinus str. CCMP1375]KGG13383.1 hypothetical protein EV04_0618 [Prochlorococcus marinus str. LG]KGG21373.1 hypothetical protein EV08_0781 [Prochlorococcus marinus str. SS2]KGG24295.1 hypothetical protein EV09_0342 [Prochlorococcus marinus str. SS35]KGG33579.1 hypothetical protein EV10_0419 [Prochlorococcus marinus str. SS51]
MNFTKFLLIDCALVLIGLAWILILQFQKDQTSLVLNLNGNKKIDQRFTKFPSLDKLLELEKLSRQKGSGIELDSLIGLWKFVSVWKKGTDNEDKMSSSLLRLFSASLELKKQQVNEDLLKFDLSNSIQFGKLSIRFIGSGWLKGSQPLLPFFFERIELKLGEIILFSRALEIPNEKDSPFFALIGMGDHGEWLSARGRGGGLALWTKDDASK